MFYLLSNTHSTDHSFLQVLDALADDTHYKYFAVLVIPMGVYFVIANWVGWQYFQNS